MTEDWKAGNTVQEPRPEHRGKKLTIETHERAPDLWLAGQIDMRQGTAAISIQRASTSAIIPTRLRKQVMPSKAISLSPKKPIGGEVEFSSILESSLIGPRKISFLAKLLCNKQNILPDSKTFPFSYG